jgi:hypothetical protein
MVITFISINSYNVKGYIDFLKSVCMIVYFSYSDYSIDNFFLRSYYVPSVKLFNIDTNLYV